MITRRLPMWCLLGVGLAVSLVQAGPRPFDRMDGHGYVKDFERDHNFLLYEAQDSVPAYILVTHRENSHHEYRVDGATLAYQHSNHYYYGMQGPTSGTALVTITEILKEEPPKRTGNYRDYKWPGINVHEPVPLFVNRPGERIPPQEKENPGLYLMMNNDDDDQNGQADLLDRSPPGENDLVPLEIAHPRAVPLNILWDENNFQIYETPTKICGDTHSNRMANVGNNIRNPPYRGYDDHVVYVEGRRPSSSYLTVVGAGGFMDRLRINVFWPRIVPDWNHDRVINTNDYDRATTNTPFRFWINDDNDEGDVASGDSDVPGEDVSGYDEPDYHNNHVDGRCDLTDFFPVWLDLHDTLKVVPWDDGGEYVLLHESGALKAVYTDLTTANAGNYLIEDERIYGQEANLPAHEAPTLTIDNNGVRLDNYFLDSIVDNRSKGILLIEGKARTTSPLILEVRREGRTLYKFELPLSVDGIEKMYRWVNLRNMNNPGILPEPENLPDDQCNRKNMVFLHGFKVDEQAARGWCAEMFKRLYWSGSRATFHAVTWFGSKTSGLDPVYQENVTNAFRTAPVLKDYVSGLNGETVVMAHSLGNMVVSSAIVDHDMHVDKYMMCNAAVPAEAYEVAHPQDDRMVNEWWKDYARQSWAANWHELFTGSGDSRARLTWRNRFRRLMSLTEVWNFYSTGDEVFTLTDDPALFSGIFNVNWWFIIPTSVNINFGRFSWQKQELFKGVAYDHLVDMGTTKYAGWGFNSIVTGPDDEGRYNVEPVYTPDEAAAATPADFKAQPAFAKYPSWLVGNRELTENDIYSLLGLGIPALSAATGHGEIQTPVMPQGRQIDVNAERNKGNPTMWPDRGDPDYSDWLHSHLKAIAYFFNFPSFDRIVVNGELK